MSENKSTALIIKKVYLINDLSVNILLEMNILKLENIVFNFLRNIFIIDSYNSLEISISTYVKLIKIDIIIINKIRKMIVFYIVMKISIQTRRKLLR